MQEPGLDGRSRNKDGRIREKNGAAKMGNLAKEYPVLDAFTPSATLTGIKTRHGLDSLDEVLRFAEEKRQSRR